MHIFIIKNNNCGCMLVVSQLYHGCTVIEPSLYNVTSHHFSITSSSHSRVIQGTSSSHSITFRKRFETNEVLLLILTNYLFSSENKKKTNLTIVEAYTNINMLNKRKDHCLSSTVS